MNEIEIIVHLPEERTIAVKIAEDATIGQLIQKTQAAGAAIGEPGEEILLLVENQEKQVKREHILREHGIRHGHHLHLVVIVVNTREKIWWKREISFVEVVVLAFGSVSPDPNVVYTVTYARGPEHHREGSLVKGKSVKVKCGMIFNVTQTNKS